MRAPVMAVMAMMAWWPPALPAAAAPATPALPAIEDPYPGIAAAYAMSIDGRLTWAAHPDQKRPPASLAKLLAALVLLEGDWDPHAPVRVSAQAAGIEGSRIGLRANEVVRAADLLTGMLVRSGNDACLALVEHFAGGMPAFAARMNRHAQALGMRDSHFGHACGLDAPGQHTTARDLLKLGAAAQANADIAARAAMPSASITTLGGRRLQFGNSNALVGRAAEVIGLKSGFTRRAGQCVIAVARRDGHTAMLVMLGAEDRWWEATGMLARALSQASPRPRLH